MFHYKRFLLLGSIVLLAVTLFTFSPKSASKAFAAGINGCPPSLSPGANTAWVQVLQANLNGYSSNGFFNFSGYPLSVDGQYGSTTKTAVLAWQSYLASRVSGGSGDPQGVVGNGTWAALGLCVNHTWVNSLHNNGLSIYTRCPSVSLSNGSSGIWVQALQDMLNVDLWFGYWSNTPQPFTIFLANDGSFGAQTQAAVTDFQHANHIGHDGMVGPQTWAKLRMCW